MMRDLTALLEKRVSDDDAGRPFRMITRRVMHRYNSSMEQVKGKARTYNPAFLNPDDLTDLGLESGDLAEICSSRASITAVVEADPTVRRGMVSMSHTFGALPGEPEDPRAVGANTGRLLQADRDLDRYSGQPRMSNVAVDVRPAPAA